jgi:hypothetical protein
MDMKKLAELDSTELGKTKQDTFMAESKAFVAYLVVNGLLPFRQFYSGRSKGLWEVVIREHVCNERSKE